MTILTPEIRPATTSAVQCKVCKTLHLASASSYVVLVGELHRRENSHGRWIERTVGLGTNENPVVICDNDDCILGLMKSRDGS